MIIPYSTDKTDNFIGYGAIGIIAACLVGFGISWPVHTAMEKRIQQDSLEVWMMQSLASDTSEAFDFEGAPASDPDRSPSTTIVPPDTRTVKRLPGGEQADEFNAVLERKLAARQSSLDSLAKRMLRVVASESPLYTFGFFPAGGRWFPGLITHQFLHGGWMHLLGNLIFFFAFGVAIERRFGLEIFLGLYLIGGAFAALCQVGATTGLQGHLPEVTLVGASGSIAAIMGAFLRAYPTSRVKVFVWLFRPLLGQIPAWVFLGMWVVMEFLRSHFLMPHETGGGTAYMAHVSGFFLGFVVVPFLPVTEEAKEMEENEKRLRPMGKLPTWEQANAPARSPFSLPSGPTPARSSGPGFSIATNPSATPPVSRPQFAPAPIERPSTTLADQAWDALDRGEEFEAVSLLQRQFHHWLRGGSAELELLNEQILRIAKKRPSLPIAPLVQYECGTRLSENDVWANSARFCLEKVEESLADLPPSLLSRCREILESLPAPAPEPAPAHPPRPAPIPNVTPPRPTPSDPPLIRPKQAGQVGTGNDGRPSWLVD